MRNFLQQILTRSAYSSPCALGSFRFSTVQILTKERHTRFIWWNHRIRPLCYARVREFVRCTATGRAGGEVPKHGTVLSSGPWQGPPAVPGGEGAWHRDGQRPREIFFAPSDKSATKSFAVRPSELFSSGETAVTSHWGDPIQNWW